MHRIANPYQIGSIPIRASTQSADPLLMPLTLRISRITLKPAPTLATSDQACFACALLRYPSQIRHRAVPLFGNAHLLRSSCAAGLY